MSHIIIYSKNKSKITKKKYEIFIDDDDLDKIQDLEIGVSINYLNVVYIYYRIKTPDGHIKTLSLPRLLAGIRHISPNKKVIIYRNNNPLDLTKENMEVVSLEEFRKRKHGYSGSDFGFSI